MSELPFLATFGPLPPPGGPAAPPAPVPAGEPAAAYAAAVAGVRTGFRHLSAADIAYPPHQWFDAMLARQIAIHIAIRRLQIGQRRLAAEIERNKGAIVKALQTVERRRADADFATAYEAMAAAAEQALEARK